MWVKLDDGFDEHPKTEGLSDAAFRLLVSSWCYSGRNLTDGLILKQKALRLSLTASEEVIAELVAVGYWDPHPDGYVAHDFLDRNPSKAAVEEQRERKSRAGKKGAASRWADGSSHSTSHSTSDGTAHGVGTGSSMPPTRPDPSKKTRSLGSSTEPVDNETIVEAVAASDPAVKSVLEQARKKTRPTTVTPMFKKKDPA